MKNNFHICMCIFVFILCQFATTLLHNLFFILLPESGRQDDGKSSFSNINEVINVVKSYKLLAHGYGLSLPAFLNKPTKWGHK